MDLWISIETGQSTVMDLAMLMESFGLVMILIFSILTLSPNSWLLPAFT